MDPSAQDAQPNLSPDAPQEVRQNAPQDAQQDPSEYYVWQVSGKPVAVHIKLSVIDRLSAELLRGYGANPKRGAEIGGVLIGRVEEGAGSVVRVEDFEVVPCQYRRGPSYVFTAEDCEPFERAALRTDAVGYFRSHTREGLSLGADDIELLDHVFAGPSTVALLVKPYATKACAAGIFIREDGTFPNATPLEFPFRRQELTGQQPPARRSLLERRDRRRDRGPSIEQPSGGHGYTTDPVLPTEPATYAYSPPADRAARNPDLDPAYSASHKRNGWVWIPLSFVFLALGAVLGYEAALSIGNRASNTPTAEYSLSLSVTKAGQNLNVHWDRLAPAVRASRRGVLEIEEKGVSKPVELDSAQLQNGTLVYHSSTNAVHFRLTVFPGERVSVTESADWKQ